MTGKEEAFFDGKPVERRRRVSLQSQYQFSVAGSNYGLFLKTKNLRRGIFECSLSSDGVRVAALETEYVVRRRWLRRTATVGGTALVLYGSYEFSASFLVSASGFVLVSLLSLVWQARDCGYVIRPVPDQVGEGV